MAYQQREWWENYPEVEQTPPRRIEGPPRQPAPQTAPQARRDELGVVRDTVGIEADRARLERERIEREQLVQRDTGGRNFEDEARLTERFRNDPVTRNYQSVLPMFGAAVRAADNPVGDMQIITAWVKTYDPSGSVQNQDVSNAENAQSAIDRLRSTSSLWTGNGRLRPEVRRNFLMELRTRGAALAQSYNQLRESVAQQARQYNFDPERVLGPHPAIPFRDEEELLMGRRVGNMRIPGEQDQPTPEPTARSRRGGVENVFFGTPEEQQAQADRLTNERGEVLTGYYNDAQGNRVPMYGPPHGRGAGQDAQRVRDLESAASRGVPLFGPVFGGIDAALGSEGGSAFRRGLVDTSTLGFSDEIAAMAQAGIGAGDFNRILDRERAVNRYDERNNFGSRIAGQVAGGFTLPFPSAGLGRQALVGAAYGGAYGLGSGEGQNRLPSAAAGAALGLGTGALGGMIGNRLNRQIPEVPELVNPATGRINAPLESVRPGQRVGMAREFGIDLPLGSAGDRSAAILEKGLDNLPASAGIMNDARRRVQGQVDQAIEGVASRYGPAETLYAGGQAAQRGAQAWMSRFDRMTETAYNRIPISADTPSSLGNTRGFLQAASEQFSSNPEMQALMRNPRLERYQQALSSGGLSWQDLKAFRTAIGSEIGEARFSDSPTRDQLRGLYGALSEDMRATAAARGPRALQAFERANTLYRQGQDRIDNALVAILGDNARNNPEAAAATIQTIARSGRGSANIQQLTQIRNSMRKGDEWSEVASSLLRLMGQPANSTGREFNPQTFVQNYSDMSEPARNLLFGDGGRRELRGALDSFVMVSQRLANTNALRNTSNTVPNMIGGGTVLTGLGAIKTALTDPVTGGAALGGLIGLNALNYGSAKLWTNPGFVRWATGFNRVAAKGPPGAVRTQLGRLATVVGRDPALVQEATSLQQQLARAVNDNLAPAARPMAASQPGQRPDEEDERRPRGITGPRY